MNRILFILHFPPPVHGASMVGKFIKESESINEVFDVRYINLGTSASVDEIGKGGIRKLFRYIKILRDILYQLLSFKPGLCYLAIAAKGGAFYKDAMIALIIKSFGFNIVYHFHNKGVKTRQGRSIYNLFYKLIFKNAEVILLSKHLYFDVKKYVPTERVHYCPNGIPKVGVEQFERQQNKKTEILFLSNLIESKGVFVLLKACKMLKSRNLDFHCTFVGGEGDLNERQFNKRVEDLGIESSVQYLGRKYGKDKKAVFASADIFSLPTFYPNECFPLVLLEAMQNSLPVVSTFEGGIQEIVDEGKTGFLVPQKDAPALAEKLETLIMDADLRQKMGKAGRKKYEEQFTLPIFEERLTNILNSIVAG